MTTIAAYISRSDAGVVYGYLMSDSRVSWLQNGRPVGRPYDQATKLFPLRNSPDCFAYAGNSLLGTLTLHSIAACLDYRPRFRASTCVEEKSRVVESMIRDMVGEFPVERSEGGIVVVYASYEPGRARFFEYSIEGEQRAVSRQEIDPEDADRSSFVQAWGSGAVRLRSRIRRRAELEGEVARTYYRSFFELLGDDSDSLSGGAPQIVQIGPDGPARPWGLRYGGQTYVFGVPSRYLEDVEDLEIRDESYGLFDAEGNRLSRSQHHVFRQLDDGGS